MREMNEFIFRYAHDVNSRLTDIWYKVYKDMMIQDVVNNCTVPCLSMEPLHNRYTILVFRSVFVIYFILNHSRHRPYKIIMWIDICTSLFPVHINLKINDNFNDLRKYEKNAFRSFWLCLWMIAVVTFYSLFFVMESEMNYLECGKMWRGEFIHSIFFGI